MMKAHDAGRHAEVLKLQAELGDLPVSEQIEAHQTRGKDYIPAIIHAHGVINLGKKP